MATSRAQSPLLHVLLVKVSLPVALGGEGRFLEDGEILKLVGCCLKAPLLQATSLWWSLYLQAAEHILKRDGSLGLTPFSVVSSSFSVGWQGLDGGHSGVLIN